MNWDKIDISSILKVLRLLEENSLTIDGEYAIIYSDGKEEKQLLGK
jgi:hypothetical protein